MFLIQYDTYNRMVVRTSNNEEPLIAPCLTVNFTPFEIAQAASRLASSASIPSSARSPESQVLSSSLEWV